MNDEIFQTAKVEGKGKCTIVQALRLCTGRRTACTEPQCLYMGAFYLYLLTHSMVQSPS